MLFALIQTDRKAIGDTHKFGKQCMFDRGSFDVSCFPLSNTDVSIRTTSLLAVVQAEDAGLRQMGGCTNKLCSGFVLDCSTISVVNFI